MIETIVNNINIPRLLWVIKKRIAWIIIFTLVGALGLGYYTYTNSVDIYRAQVSMYVYSDPSYRYDVNVNVTNNEFIAAKNLVKSYIMVLKSKTILSKIVTELNLSYNSNMLQNMIDAYAVEDTAIFYIYVDCTDPYTAMEIANALAEKAPDEIARVVKSGGVEVLDYATLPTIPYYTANIQKYTILGAAAGFLLSAVIFIFIGLLDTVIRKKNELEEQFHLPILGEIPAMYDHSRKQKANKILGDSSPFVIRESYSMARTNLLFTGKGEKCPVYAFTSADINDGKTINAINIAISFSNIGKKVLLIDCDLRSPSIGEILKMERHSQGLSQYLAGLTDKVNVYESEVERLSILSAGEIPPNPSELMASIRFKRLLDTVKEQYDFIFLDLSPLGIVADPIQIIDCITGYIVIVRNNYSKMKSVKSVIQKLENVKAPVAGFIYNAVEFKPQKVSKYSKYETVTNSQQKAG